MANLLETGATWLSGQLKSHASATVTYRNDHGEVSISAVRGETMLQEISQSGGVVQEKVRDYMVESDDLVIDLEQFVPKAGDCIIDGNLTCEVMPLGDSAPYEYSDPHRIRMRIHTKVVKDNN